MVDGVTTWISEIATAWPLVWTTSKVSTVQHVANTLFLTLEHVFGRINILSVYRSIFMLAGKLLAWTFRTPTRSGFSIAARKNCPGSARLLGIQYRIASVLAKLYLSEVIITELPHLRSFLFWPYSLLYEAYTHCDSYCVVQNLYG